MKLKKSLLAILALSSIASVGYAEENAAATASAPAADTQTKKDDNPLMFKFGEESSVTLYGLIDAAYITQSHGYSLNNTLPNQSYSYVGKLLAGTTAQTGLANGGLSDSRLGLKGDIGVTSGVKVIFDLESGFDVTNMKLNNAAGSLAQNSGTGANSTLSADSSVNGQIFNRAQWVGVQSNLGKLTWGRQNDPTKDVIGEYDPVKSDTFSPFGESGTVGGGMGSSEASRMQHSLKYANKFANGIDVSVAYAWGDDWSTSTGNTVAGKIAYTTGNLGIAAGYSNSKDAIVAGTGTTLGTIKASAYDVDGYVLTGKYKFDNAFNMSGGYEHYERKAPSDTLAIGSLWGYTVTSTSTFSATQSQAFNVYFLGGDHDFTSHLNLALGYYNTKADQEAGTATVTDYTIDTYSAVLKYAYTKSLDLYAGATSNRFGGGLYTANPQYATSINAYGAGARFKF